MADQLKQIKEFPQKADFGDDDLLLIQGNGTTYNVSGRAVKRYAENAAAPQVELARKEAQAAADAADRAEDAIQHPSIPDPVSKNWLVWDQVSEEYGETVPPVRAEGRDFEIKGYYPTLEALETAVPEPGVGWAYGVGAQEPYDIYVWDAVHGVWVNNGALQGPRGEQGPEGPQGPAGPPGAAGAGIPAGGTAGQVLSKASAEDRDVEWRDPPEGVGRSMAGKTVEPEQGTTVTAGTGAEIFNDYRDRAWGTDTGYEVVVPTRGNIASGSNSHAEGNHTTATGSGAHAEGTGTLASGPSAHAEGGKFAGQVGPTASAYGAHAEGTSTTASGGGAHSEGRGTVASGVAAHAEGQNTTASGANSHAQGYLTIASSSYAHSEGYKTTASALAAHAEGYQTTASGEYSHAGGLVSVADGTHAFSHGYGAIAHAHQYVFGWFNVDAAKADTLILGNGAVNGRSNSFRACSDGVFSVGSYHSSGADYAELFEWADGNRERVDRSGLFVTLEGESIRLAGPGDDYILGIVSGAPSVVGDVYDDQWQGMYLADVFGRPIWEDVEVPAVTEEAEYPVEVPGEGEEAPQVEIRRETRVVIPAHTERRQKLNPAYDNRQLPYIPRSERPEWDAVGMLGKLVAVDDGSCRVNGWAAVGEGGAATNSEERTKYRVMARLDDRHVRILIL